MLELTALEPVPALKSWRSYVLREIEEQFAILERIPYRETDLLLSVLGEHIGKELLTVRSGRKNS